MGCESSELLEMEYNSKLCKVLGSEGMASEFLLQKGRCSGWLFGKSAQCSDEVTVGGPLRDGGRRR